MSSNRLLVVSLMALAVAGCSLAEGGADFDEAKKSNKDPGPTATQTGEIKDFEPAPPVWVENSRDLFAGLPVADFRDDITTKDTTVPTTFLLNSYDTPVKSQGSRPWCTSFAQTAVIENMINHGFGVIVDLSDIDHWSHYQQLSCYSSIQAAAKTLIVPESSYPYYGSPIANYRSTAIAKITTWRSLTKRSQVFDAIRAGHPVHIGVDLRSSWNSPGKNGRIAISGGMIGGHAMAVVGYQEDATYQGGGYMLIKNSWGSKWGDMGYARMPYDYCLTGNCIFLETLGVVYDGKTWDGSTVPPPPPPGDDPVAADFEVAVRKEPGRADRFKLSIKEKKAGVLAKVEKVTYDVHETFGANRYATVTDPADGFVMPVYYTTTFKGRWPTNAAALQLKSGKTITLPGAVIAWYYVDSYDNP